MGHICRVFEFGDLSFKLTGIDLLGCVSIKGKQIDDIANFIYVELAFFLLSKKKAASNRRFL